jgi:hypothetical protein
MSPDLDLKQGISYLERERGRGREIEGRNTKIAGRDGETERHSNRETKRHRDKEMELIIKIPSKAG